jgi:hypothetical protein
VLGCTRRKDWLTSGMHAAQSKQDFGTDLQEKGNLNTGKTAVRAKAESKEVEHTASGR